MIDKRWENNEQVFTPTCDVCSETLEDEYDFYDAVNAKKAAGWQSKRIDGLWYDLCPCCQKEMDNAVSDFAGIGREK